MVILATLVHGQIPRQEASYSWRVLHEDAMRALSHGTECLRIYFMIKSIGLCFLEGESRASSSRGAVCLKVGGTKLVLAVALRFILNSQFF